MRKHMKRRCGRRWGGGSVNESKEREGWRERKRNLEKPWNINERRRKGRLRNVWMRRVKEKGRRNEELVRLRHSGRGEGAKEGEPFIQKARWEDKVLTKWTTCRLNKRWSGIPGRSGKKDARKKTREQNKWWKEPQENQRSNKRRGRGRLPRAWTGQGSEGDGTLSKWLEAKEEREWRTENHWQTGIQRSKGGKKGCRGSKWCTDWWAGETAGRWRASQQVSKVTAEWAKEGDRWRVGRQDWRGAGERGGVKGVEKRKETKKKVDKSWIGRCWKAIRSAFHSLN